MVVGMLQIDLAISNPHGSKKILWNNVANLLKAW